MRAWMLLLAMVCSSAHGQAVYKCVGSRGEVSYQSDPCAGAKTAKTWEVERAQPITWDRVNAQIRAEQKAFADSQYLRQQARRARNGAGPGTVIGNSSNGINACADMKRQRDEYLESEHGRHASYDGRRAWNDRVYDACK